jgi:hypothetical protein
MDTNTQVLQQCFLQGVSDLSDDILPMDTRTDDAIRRSEVNVLDWMSYLPADCIRTMIAMGWDVST